MKKQRGVVILFCIFVVLLMLAFAGLAVDGAALLAERSELHRATDAAALAGAGKLGFDSSVFPTVRSFAVTYAANNPTPFGAVSLNSNNSNAANGDVVLGIWNAGTFTPSLDGTQVNAVLCQTTRAVPMTFARILGLTVMPMSAQSIAVSNPPNSLPPNACMFPMGVTACQFQNAGAWTSQGCGTPVTFATSSGQPPNTNAGTNTGAWINPTGTGNPNASTLSQWLAAAAGGGPCNPTLVAGQSVGANNGMIQPVVDDLEQYFIQKYNASQSSGQPYTAYDTSNNPVYTGYGWEVYVPVIQTACPPQAINQDVMIYTFTKFIITQVINKGDCAVANSADGNSWPLCPPPMNPQGAPKDSSLRSIFGYFECGGIESVPAPFPAPRAALGTKLRLVQ